VPVMKASIVGALGGEESAAGIGGAPGGTGAGGSVTAWRGWPARQSGLSGRGSETSTTVGQRIMRRNGKSRFWRITGLQTPERPLLFDLTTQFLCQRCCTKSQCACRSLVHLGTESRTMPNGCYGMAYLVNNRRLALYDVLR
jgi:hypothetical protein